MLRARHVERLHRSSFCEPGGAQLGTVNFSRGAQLLPSTWRALEKNRMNHTRFRFLCPSLRPSFRPLLLLFSSSVSARMTSS